MFRSASNFEKLLDKATSNLRLEPDWPTILQLCDLIRQGDVQSKQALAHIKKKMLHENPHVAYFGLLVLESCVKNCGSIIHDEIGTTTYMNQLRELLKSTTQEKLKNKILELIQAWAFAFRNSPKYRAVQDTMNILKAEDHKFPPLKESDAMFSADTAPEWADGDCCHRCRVPFSIMQRKHHCRACGQVFCGQCSSKQCTLPKFGIEKEVRVCDTCLANNSTKSTKTSSSPPPTKSEDLPSEYLNSSLAKQNQAPPPRKSDEELQEEEELQLAIALSQSEAEHKQKLPSTRVKNYSSQQTTRTSSPPVEDVDPELARYLNRSYWENRPQSAAQSQPQPHSSPSAPANFASMVGTQHKVLNTSVTPTVTSQSPVATHAQNGASSAVETDAQLDEFVLSLQDQVDVFVNRMKSNYSRGRAITNDSTVQSSFMSITDAHSKLLRYIQQQDDSRVYYEGLQDKLAQVKDARAALNALREEHRERLRREAEMAEQQRQMQMAHKLEIMRKKKQEYLQYQRQVALQRIQEQEREMQMRQEQQKQQYMMATNYNPIAYQPTIPGGYETPGGMNMVMNHPHANPAFAPAPVPAGYQYPMNDWRPNYMPPQNQPYMMQPGGMVMGAPPQMGVRGAPGMGQPQTLPTAAQMGPQTQGVPGQLQMQTQQTQGGMGPQSLPPQTMGPQSLQQQGVMGPQSMGPQSLPQQGGMGTQNLPQQGNMAPQNLPQGTMAPQNLPQGTMAPQNLPQGGMAPLGQNPMGGIPMSPKSQQGGTAPTQNGVGAPQQGGQIMTGPQMMMAIHGMAPNMPPVYQQQMPQQNMQQIPPQNQQPPEPLKQEPPQTAELISFD
ncbi:hepatocyte growth factor-regulated tyrosine kinase substrate [Nilaparvata lugens]|uniref:hepatocyte growth factor-regulated tyrosine kinase substrate n=1 Tax=Nilaparvata lugens TaxID=108931 RepID=UPI00193DFAB7|nr:hepatocyte growth factor-regulated tyrosine kinase substrate [Nilaparvata lugens]